MKYASMSICIQIKFRPPPKKKKIASTPLVFGGFTVPDKTTRLLGIWPGVSTLILRH